MILPFIESAASSYKFKIFCLSIQLIVKSATDAMVMHKQNYSLSYTININIYLRIDGIIENFIHWRMIKAFLINFYTIDSRHLTCGAKSSENVIIT